MNVSCFESKAYHCKRSCGSINAPPILIARRRTSPDVPNSVPWIEAQLMPPFKEFRKEVKRKKAGQQVAATAEASKPSAGWRILLKKVTDFLSSRAPASVRLAMARLQRRLFYWNKHSHQYHPMPVGVSLRELVDRGQVVVKLPDQFLPKRIIYVAPNVRVVEGLCQNCQLRMEKKKEKKDKKEKKEQLDLLDI